MKLASSGPSTESFGEGGSPRSEEGGASLSPDADAPFRSAAVAEKLRQHHLWHGDLLAGGGAFAPFRAWLEARLPAVTQTTAGYFTAALVRHGAAAARGDAGAGSGAAGGAPFAGGCAFEGAT